MPAAPLLCETFRAIAFRTHDRITTARRVSHQLLEETFTDMYMLELKSQHSDEVFTRTYNRREEARTGADWEWWLTNWSMDRWLGLRVQAKVINIESETFRHLHYRSGKSKTYQSTILNRSARQGGLIPLYVLYTFGKFVFDPAAISWPCPTFGHAPESFGCSIVSAAHVESLRKDGLRCSYDDVMCAALPWSCLVCCSGFGGTDLPSRAWSLLRSSFEVRAPSSFPVVPTAVDALGLDLPRCAPDYVMSVVEGSRGETEPAGLSGVLVLRERRVA